MGSSNSKSKQTGYAPGQFVNPQFVNPQFGNPQFGFSQNNKSKLSFQFILNNPPSIIPQVQQAQQAQPSLSNYSGKLSKIKQIILNYNRNIWNFGKTNLIMTENDYNSFLVFIRSLLQPQQQLQQQPRSNINNGSYEAKKVILEIHKLIGGNYRLLNIFFPVEVSLLFPGVLGIKQDDMINVTLLTLAAIIGADHIIIYALIYGANQSNTYLAENKDPATLMLAYQIALCKTQQPQQQQQLQYQPQQQMQQQQQQQQQQLQYQPQRQMQMQMQPQMQQQQQQLQYQPQRQMQMQPQMQQQLSTTLSKYFISLPRILFILYLLGSVNLGVNLAAIFETNEKIIKKNQAGIQQGPVNISSSILHMLARMPNIQSVQINSLQQTLLTGASIPILFEILENNNTETIPYFIKNIDSLENPYDITILYNVLMNNTIDDNTKLRLVELLVVKCGSNPTTIPNIPGINISSSNKLDILLYLISKTTDQSIISQILQIFSTNPEFKKMLDDSKIDIKQFTTPSQQTNKNKIIQELQARLSSFANKNVATTQQLQELITLQQQKIIAEITNAQSKTLMSSPQSQYTNPLSQPQYPNLSPQSQYTNPLSQPQYPNLSQQSQYTNPLPQPQYPNLLPQSQYTNPLSQPQYPNRSPQSQYTNPLSQPQYPNLLPQSQYTNPPLQSQNPNPSLQSQNPRQLTQFSSQQPQNPRQLTGLSSQQSQKIAQMPQFNQQYQLQKSYPQQPPQKSQNLQQFGPFSSQKYSPQKNNPQQYMKRGFPGVPGGSSDNSHSGGKKIQMRTFHFLKYKKYSETAFTAERPIIAADNAYDFMKIHYNIGNKLISFTIHDRVNNKKYKYIAKTLKDGTNVIKSQK